MLFLHLRSRLQWKAPLIRKLSTSPLRHKFRRASPVFAQAEVTDGSPAQVLQRVSYYLAQGVPDVAIGYFNGRMSEDNTRIPERAQIFEAVLDLFLRERHYEEVEKVNLRMENERLQLSPLVHAKLVTARFANGSVTEEDFLETLRQLFRSSDAHFSVWHFLGLLSLVLRTASPSENCEKVLDLYLKAKGPDYRLDPLLVTFMVELHVKAGNRSEAERWLDHHSSRLQKSESDPTLCHPYAAFISSLAESTPSNSDPAELYAPILDRLTADGLSPDTALVNTLITLELRHGRPHVAFEFYTALRESLTRDVFPDAITFSQLFTAAGRAALDARRQDSTPPSVIPSRALFRDMLMLQAMQSKDELSAHSPVLSTSSLGQALWQFVAAYDYAAACVALRAYVTQHVPVEEHAVIGSVTSALLERCRREIRLSQAESRLTRPEQQGASTSSWVSTFLNLRTLAPWRLKGEPARDTERRMIDAAKRDLMLSAMSTAAAKAGPASDKTTAEPSAQGIFHMQYHLRERRLRLVDALLTRALSASFVDEQVVQSPADLRKRAERAIRDAATEMLPSEDVSDTHATTAEESASIVVSPTALENTSKSKSADIMNGIKSKTSQESGTPV